VEVLPYLVKQEMLYASSDSFPICEEVTHHEQDEKLIYKYRVAFQDTGAIVLPASGPLVGWLQATYEWLKDNFVIMYANYSMDDSKNESVNSYSSTYFKANGTTKVKFSNWNDEMENSIEKVTHLNGRKLNRQYLLNLNKNGKELRHQLKESIDSNAVCHVENFSDMIVLKPIMSSFKSLKNKADEICKKEPIMGINKGGSLHPVGKVDDERMHRLKNIKWKKTKLAPRKSTKYDETFIDEDGDAKSYATDEEKPIPQTINFLSPRARLANNVKGTSE
jgi:hypothetical protein